MSNVVINVTHKPAAWLATGSGRAATPLGAELGLQAGIMGCERASDSGGFIPSGARKESLERSEPWPRRPMESWLGPRPQRGCARLVPHTCWEESGTHFSLAAPLAAKLSHASLSGLLGA